MPVFNRHHSVSWFASNSMQCGVPVDLVSLSAFRRKMVGACVSRKSTAVRINNRASKAEITQNSHRQPMASVTTPPMIGPRAGPRSGMNVVRANPLPRSSGFRQSLRTGSDIYTSWRVSAGTVRQRRVVLTANIALPPSPAINRVTIITPSL